MSSKTEVVKKPTVEILSNDDKLIKFETELDKMTDSVNKFYKEIFYMKENLPSIKDVPGIDKF